MVLSDDSMRCPWVVRRSVQASYFGATTYTTLGLGSFHFRLDRGVLVDPVSHTNRPRELAENRNEVNPNVGVMP